VVSHFSFSLFFTIPHITMQGKDIASIEAFNLDSVTGNYANMETELQSFISVSTSAKSLKAKLIAARAAYVAKFDGVASARISVLAKGAESPIQFAPNAAFLAALDAMIAAVTTFETATGAIDFPTA
jgi:hypothetical protein